MTAARPSRECRSCGAINTLPEDAVAGVAVPCRKPDCKGTPWKAEAVTKALVQDDVPKVHHTLRCKDPNCCGPCLRSGECRYCGRPHNPLCLYCSMQLAVRGMRDYPPAGLEEFCAVCTDRVEAGRAKWPGYPRA